MRPLRTGIDEGTQEKMIKCVRCGYRYDGDAILADTLDVCPQCQAERVSEYRTTDVIEIRFGTMPETWLSLNDEENVV
jgi:NMD protein affecting ribosome stability and mRNA decay